MKYQSQRGVALVITLIMLSVITFLTIAFLAVSRRDRASVTTSLNQTDSHLMADTALARVQSEMTTRMMAQGTLQSYDLMLTRNYVNPLGFNPALGLNTTNVNYDYRNDGNPLANNDPIFNIANLFYDPRPPVFIQTNRDKTLPLDFRFYLDYNRNYRFETNGSQPIVLDEAGNILLDANNQPILKDYLGEPEWIGVLQNPEYPHSPTNRFIGRYLYLALPISRTLDLNYIHNYAKGNIGLPPQVSSANGDGFLRNQGYGSYEINLAAFLQDLNTNMYPYGTGSYFYDTSPARNTGTAFNDAVSFLGYRYANNFTNLSSVVTLFPGNGTTAFSGATAFGKDLIDGYSTQPVLFYPFHNTVDPDIVPANLTIQPWPGSRNPNRFFDPQELFDRTKVAPLIAPPNDFVSKLERVSANNNSYDRYTFSRLLEQIGTGSEPEVKGKININYVNDPAVNTVATNFADWIPYQFFTNVAERLIKDNLRHPNNPDGSVNTNVFYLFNTNDIANLVRPQFSVTNIQIYPTNEYTAPLHRLLQVAANVYDATTSNKYPTIYRPRFGSDNGANIINDFVVETNSVFLANALTNAIQDRTNIFDADGLVWGIPVVVGAKKGFPSFNEFRLQNSVQISRNLQITKPNTNSLPNATNQMLVLGISNVFGLEAWNSYMQSYTNQVRFIITNLLTISLTNEVGTVIWPSTGGATNFGVAMNIVSNFWPGTGSGARFNTNSFNLPINTNVTFLTNSTFIVGGNPAFVPETTNFQKGVSFAIPTWGIQMTNRLVYALIDTSQSQGRVIDFVNLDGMTAAIDISKELLSENANYPVGFTGAREPNIVRNLWKTNRIDGSASMMVPTVGIENQISVSLNLPGKKLDDNQWNQYGYKPPTSKADAINAFQMFFQLTPTETGSNGRIPSYSRSPYTNAQTPYNPTRKLDQTIAWQVNDPLVHYMTKDLLDATNSIQPRIPPNGPPVVPSNLGKINERYRPWGRIRGEDGVGPGTAGATVDSEYSYDLRVKDPRIRWSDDWDFPTNKFSSIGELGRVHRGTPWQTIYLKAAMISTNDWKTWSGHFETHPTNDWNLLDVFTASPNDNAARGLLSVNQTNQAAWSAVLSGVIALTNSLNNPLSQATSTNPAVFTSLVIQPGYTVSNIVQELNAVRATMPNGVFSSLGQILAVPSLSVTYTDRGTNVLIDASPFLNVTNYNYVGTNKVFIAAKNQAQQFYGVTDEAYERIPRQIASLLKLGEPRYVVYCYGQSLKPAPNSIVLSPPIGSSGLFNLCTNYQITGEVVTRTVLRVEPNPDAQHPKTVIESYNILPAE